MTPELTIEAHVATITLRRPRQANRLDPDDLAALGINVDCLPVLDVPDPQGHEVIGDRAYAKTPDEVARLGRAAAEGLIAIEVPVDARRELVEQPGVVGRPPVQVHCRTMAPDASGRWRR